MRLTEGSLLPFDGEAARFVRFSTAGADGPTMIIEICV